MDDNPGSFPAAPTDCGDVELEGLGLCLFDVDMDLKECFESCPEWNVSYVLSTHTLISPCSKRYR